MYSRILTLPEKSFFLFGPRGTGKSVWLDQRLDHAALSINLLKSGEYLRYKRDPSLLAQEVAALRNKKAWIIIDEVQKLPELLDEVHALLFESRHEYLFALSGSSARKPKRSHANMLAGLALSKRMFPLSMLEIGRDFRLPDVLRYVLGYIEANGCSRSETSPFSLMNRLSRWLRRGAFFRRLRNRSLIR